MDSRTVGIGLLLVMFGVASVKAEEGNLAEGQTLYNKECSVCHGVMSHTKTSGPDLSRRHPVHLAMAPSTGLSVADFQVPLSTDRIDARADNDLHPGHTASRDVIAVVPIYGPPLKGVIGRVAGTYSGYTYSKAFMQKMEGVVWDEAKLDIWVKSSQTMVPGSYMFYSHKNQDVRGKIIEYLKAQSR